MEKYENLEIIGEGSYGIVMKCRHKETGQVVAIKKFLESIDNVNVRKLALREIRMLKRIRHENLISLIEVFRLRKRFYLVFEYLDHTILDELEAIENGLGFELSRRHIFQVLRGLHFCHKNHIIHRDVKPENVLVSTRGIVKLCDFGFSRIVASPNESCTDYVATRWYRAPELLVGDVRYGRAVDTWAVGCLFAEMTTGKPLFPGDTDLDQLFRITRVLGGLCVRHQSLLNRTMNFRTLRKPCVVLTSSKTLNSLRTILPGCEPTSLDFLMQCLRMDPEVRATCAILLQHSLFHQENFAERFLAELNEHITREVRDNPLLRINHDDCCKLSVLTLHDTPKSYASEAARWQIKLISESTLDAKKPWEGRNYGQMLAEGDQLHLRRSREFCFPEPGCVTSNTNYAHRLRQRNLLGNAKVRNNIGNLVLPALATRDGQQQQQQQQRRKPSEAKSRILDLPSAKVT